MLKIFIAAFIGSLAGSVAGFWWVFKTWRFPRIILLSLEDLARMKANLVQKGG